MGLVESIKNFFRGESDHGAHRNDPSGSSKMSFAGKSADEILKEIVDAINGMNHRLMSLERAVGNASAHRSRVMGRADSQEDPWSKEQHAVGPRVRVQESSQAKNSLADLIGYVEKFQDRCEAVIKLLSKNRNEASDRLTTKCKSILEKVRSEMSAPPSSSLTRDDYYKGLSETLESIRLMDLAIYLCRCAEDEMGEKSESETQLLLNAMEELVGPMRYAFISPNPGERYDEKEQEIIGQERNSGFPAGSIAKVHTRGLKNLSSGKVKRKARVSLAM